VGNRVGKSAASVQHRDPPPTLDRRGCPRAKQPGPKICKTKKRLLTFIYPLRAIGPVPKHGDKLKPATPLAASAKVVTR
jgi:hypothetical protein